MLQFIFSDHGEAFDIGEVFEIEFDVFPCGAGIPALEAGHIEQHTQFAMLPDQPLALRHEGVIVRAAPGGRRRES